MTTMTRDEWTDGLECCEHGVPGSMACERCDEETVGVFWWDREADVDRQRWFHTLRAARQWMRRHGLAMYRECGGVSWHHIFARQAVRS